MKFKFELGDLIKIPNILCYIRIIMVPLFCYVYVTADEPSDYYFATFIVLLSGATDFLDGQIARRCNMITDLGKLIDPIADKLMQLAMLVVLTFNVEYMYLLVIYLVFKEFILAVTGFFVMRVAKKRLNGAKWYGKVCTAVLYAVMVVMVALPDMNDRIQNIMLLVCTAVLTLSLVMYGRVYLIMIRDRKAGYNDKALY